MVAAQFSPSTIGERPPGALSTNTATRCARWQRKSNPSGDDKRATESTASAQIHSDTDNAKGTQYDENNEGRRMSMRYGAVSSRGKTADGCNLSLHYMQTGKRSADRGLGHVF